MFIFYFSLFLQYYIYNCDEFLNYIYYLILFDINRTLSQNHLKQKEYFHFYLFVKKDFQMK